MKKILSLLLITLMVSTTIFADDLDSLFANDEIFEEDNLFSEDTLFTDGNLFEDNSGSNPTSINLADDLLTESATLSGSYSFNFQTGLTYNFDTGATPTYYSTSDISTELVLSARPTTDTRFYAKGNLTYPFFNTEDDSATLTVNEEYNYFSLDELFYDFLLDEDYFIRVGKQTLNMGVGYFYSPANLLNITSINPLEPESDQKGPMAIKINKPIGNDNLYGYITLPNSSNYEPTEIGYAAKVEKIIGNGEYTLSGFYTYDQATSPTKLALTASTSLFTDIDVFAEAVESYDGSDFKFAGTAGIQILKNLENLVDTSISFIAQYYYNQDGVSTFGTQTYDASQQLAGLLSLSLPNDYGISLLSINVLKENSGVLVGNMWYNATDDLSISAGATYSYGATNTIKPYISLTLGKGDF